MIKFVVGVVVGITLATVGLSGVAHIVDSGVAKIQQITKEATK
jgi:hypothetical protein